MRVILVILYQYALLFTLGLTPRRLIFTKIKKIAITVFCAIYLLLICKPYIANRMFITNTIFSFFSNYFAQAFMVLLMASVEMLFLSA